MSAISRARRRLPAGIVAVLLALLAVMAVAAAAASAVAAQPAAAPGFVKYYIVQSTFDGKAEDLAEIAARFLGSPARSTEIFGLNEGVPQPGGGELTNPAVIDPGWVLVLPWDAVGPGVQYGLRPTAPAAPAAAPAVPASAPARPASAPVRRPSKAAPACAGTSPGTSGSQDDWGMLRVAPQQAWPYSRGAGVTVAIVDSGVDAGAPGLAGRVTASDDIAGRGQGNTDCLGSGTAMAGIVAGSSAASGGTGAAVGMAPAATIMPVRVASANATVPVPDQVEAIQVAASRGAKVIALGGYIDPAEPAVASAMAAAAGRGAVVVAGAPVRSPDAGTGSGGAATTPGVILVGAIGIDGTAAADYQPGAVDVVAPGVDVAGQGPTRTGQSAVSGTQYAVAFAAGEAALVRARYPDLTAAQVARRIERSAYRMSHSAPSSTFGWGLIDPAAAVTTAVISQRDGPANTATPASASSPARAEALAIAGALALIVVLLLALRIRRMVRPAGSDRPDGPPPGPPVPLAPGDDLAATASPPAAEAAAEPSEASPLAGADLAGAGSAHPAASVSPWAAGAGEHDQAGGWAGQPPDDPAEWEPGW